MKIKPLEFPFTKKGWTHECVQREGPMLLVRRHKPGLPAHFEVIVSRERQEETFQRAGREIHLPYREIYPTDEDWGTYGFTYRTLEQPEHNGWTAIKRFEWLLAGRGKQQEARHFD